MRLRRNAEGRRYFEFLKKADPAEAYCAAQYFCCIAPKVSVYVLHQNGCGVSGLRTTATGPLITRGTDQVWAQIRAMPDRRPSKDQSMTEAIETTVSKSKPKASPPPAFEMPKFELPNFEMPKMEIPAAFREIAEKSVSQAKETYERMKSAAEEATDVLEDTYAAATKGASDYGLKVIEAARENTNAAFDFATQLMTVKSLSEMVELSTAHTRKQFEALTAQSKELAAIAQKVATDSADPVKESFGKVFKKVA
jgi:phasin